MNNDVPSYQMKQAELCVGCIYLSHIMTCDYILMERERRPCPAGAGCTAKTTKKKGRRTWDDGCVLPPADQEKKKKEREAKARAYRQEYRKMHLDECAARQKRQREKNKAALSATQSVIKAVREQHGFSRKDVAAALGVTVQYIGQWERGESRANWEKLIPLLPELAKRKEEA